nr:hypothetical protein [Brucella endophytica]
MPAGAADVFEPAPPEIQDQERWRILFSPYVWGVSLHGKAGLFGLDTGVDVPFREIYDHLDAAFMGNIDATNGTVGFYIDGQYVKVSKDENLLGNEVNVDITSTTLSGGVYYRMHEAALDGATLFGDPRVFALEPTVGVRWTRLKAELDAGPLLNETRKVEWTDPFVGARIFYDLTDRWNIFAEADIGGFGAGTKLSANGQIYLGYRTLLVDLPINWRVGYRALYQDYREETQAGEFKYDVTEHGPVVGFSVQY